MIYFLWSYSNFITHVWQVNRVDITHFLFYFLIIFFSLNFILHHLGWLRIWCHFFLFTIYEVIMVSRLELRVMGVSQVSPSFFCVFLIEYFFFNFILQHLIDWKFDSIFFSMDLSWSHDPDLQVNQGCLGICFCFFNWFFLN
jgi:hypothetical protein